MFADDLQRFSGRLLPQAGSIAADQKVQRFLDLSAWHPQHGVSNAWGPAALMKGLETVGRLETAGGRPCAPVQPEDELEEALAADDQGVMMLMKRQSILERSTRRIESTCRTPTC